MCLQGLVGVDGLVGHGDVEVLVAGYHLGDVGWQAVHDGVGDEHATEIMRRAMKLPAIGPHEARAGEHLVDEAADKGDVELFVLGADPVLEQQRRQGEPDLFVVVPGPHEADCPVRDRATCR